MRQHHKYELPKNKSMKDMKLVDLLQFIKIPIWKVQIMIYLKIKYNNIKYSINLSINIINKT